MIQQIESCTTCPLCIFDTELDVPKRCGHPKMPEHKSYEFLDKIKDNCPLKESDLVIKLNVE